MQLCFPKLLLDISPGVKCKAMEERGNVIGERDFTGNDILNTKRGKIPDENRKERGYQLTDTVVFVVTGEIN